MQRPPARLLASVAVLAALALGGCSTTTGVAPTPPDRSRPTPRRAPRVQWRQRDGFLGRALSRQSGRSGRGGPLRPGVARGRPARAGRGRAGAGGDPQSEQSRRARRLWPRARRQRQLPAGARRAQPRAHAGPARLAHPVGAGRGARPDGPPCRRAAATTPARCGSCPTSRRCCPISACPTRCRKICARPRTTLRRAAAQPRRRAEGAAEPRAGRRPAGPLPGGRDHRAGRSSPDEAAANVAYLRQMLAQQSAAGSKSKRSSPLAPDRPAPERDRSFCSVVSLASRAADCGDAAGRWRLLRSPSRGSRPGPE